MRKKDLALILAPCSFNIHFIAFFPSVPRSVKLAVWVDGSLNQFLSFSLILRAYLLLKVKSCNQLSTLNHLF